MQRDARINLREITATTVRDICYLSDSLSEQQKKMVAPNAVSIAQAHFSPQAWFRAVYADEIPVGFVMLHQQKKGEEDSDTDSFFLWRFMIGGSYQRLGYGKRALALVVDHIKNYGVTELKTSCGGGEGSPKGFYLKFGFKPTGNMIGDETELVLALDC